MVNINGMVVIDSGQQLPFVLVTYRSFVVRLENKRSEYKIYSNQFLQIDLFGHTPNSSM